MRFPEETHFGGVVVVQTHSLPGPEVGVILPAEMFLCAKSRRKNGKDHTYYSIVENRRLDGDRVVQKHVLYLGEISDSHRTAWERAIEAVVREPDQPPRFQTISLLPETATLPTGAPSGPDHVVQIKLNELSLRHPRQWGAVWMATHLYEKLGLGEFWRNRLPPNRKGTRWDLILQTLVTYRLISPGSEWRLHRHWFETTATADLLGVDLGAVDPHKLYSCLDLVVAHKAALFSHLNARWKDLFNANYEILLYDLTSTYFERDTPVADGDKRQYGYSRDKRPDCQQVVIALVVTPEGLPLAYEVLAGNTSDKTTLQDFLAKIQAQYGQARRIWVMDRGIPTEETLEFMRQSNPATLYLVGTPKGRLTQLEAQLLEKPWQQVREGVDVKLLPVEGELYVFARSDARVAKERAMRRRQLRGLCEQLQKLQTQGPKRDALLMKLGAAKTRYPAAWRLMEIDVPGPHETVSATTFKFRLDRAKLRQARRREGRYLLRTNLQGDNPGELWKIYMQLVRVEEAFKNLKGDLSIRPVFHQKQERVEAHIFVAFLSYCLQVTLQRWLSGVASGLTPRSVLEQLATMQMVDVHLPTTEAGKEIVLRRRTVPEKAVELILHQLKLELPAQPPPEIRIALRDLK